MVIWTNGVMLLLLICIHLSSCRKTRSAPNLTKIIMKTKELFPSPTIGLTVEEFELAAKLPIKQLVVPKNISDIGVRDDLFEGDMLRPDESIDSIVDYYSRNDTSEDLEPETPTILKNAIRNRGNLWPGGRIPYVLSNTYSSQSRVIIAAAMLEIRERTCIRFEPKTSADTDYVDISAGSGCYSYVGRVGGRQSLSLGSGCVIKGIVEHELMHAIGFVHEQSRTDRNDYITVNWDNVRAGYESQFQSYNQYEIDHLGVSYDYESVMHYGPYAFSGNGQPTITVKRSGYSIGQRTGLSEIDALKISLLYDCVTPQTTMTVTQLTPKPSMNCEDYRADCASIAAAGYCSFDSWSRQQCPKSCRQCQSITTSPCADLAYNCHLYKQQGWCNSYPTWSAINCKLTCNYCIAQATTQATTTKRPVLNCVDVRVDCLNLKSWGYCDIYPDWMHVNCLRTCNMC